MEELLTQLAASPETTKLVLMPLSRVLVESKCHVGRFSIFPPGEFDFDQFRPVSNKQLEIGDADFAILDGQELREVKTSLTGFSLEVLNHNPVVAFTAPLNWDEFLGGNHEYDTDLLKRLSGIAERAFDFIRFNCCRFDMPDTLPGIVGTWQDSGAFLGAMIYTLPDHESYLIAGEGIDCSIITKGIGLDLDCQMTDDLPQPSDGEIGAFAVHALMLFSDVMMSNNDTIKFVRAMILLEFLANPDEFKSWKKLKGDIACHCSADRAEYLRHQERFRELTHILNSEGKEAGVRTLLVHHGQFLNDIIPDQSERRSLFRELNHYCSCVLQDMLDNSTMSWKDFEDLRVQKKAALGVA